MVAGRTIARTVFMAHALGTLLTVLVLAGPAYAQSNGDEFYSSGGQGASQGPSNGAGESCQQQLKAEGDQERQAKSDFNQALTDCGHDTACQEPVVRTFDARMNQLHAGLSDIHTNCTIRQMRDSFNSSHPSPTPCELQIEAENEQEKEAQNEFNKALIYCWHDTNCQKPAAEKFDARMKQLHTELAESHSGCRPSPPQIASNPPPGAPNVSSPAATSPGDSGGPGASNGIPPPNRYIPKGEHPTRADVPAPPLFKLHAAKNGGPGRGTPSSSGGPSAVNPPSTSQVPPSIVNAPSHNPPGTDASKRHPQNPPKIVFNYFYVNGVNTPRTNNSWRGSCLSERNLVAQNLLDLPAMSGPPAPKTNVSLPSIRVANEIDQMYPEPTCNPSGQDAWRADFIAQNCSSTGGVFKYFTLSACTFLTSVNGLRAGALLGGAFTPGDFIECIRQASYLPKLHPGPQSNPMGIEATVKMDPVPAITKAIVGIYQQESAANKSAQPVKNYFVVVGHSQGNFFVEGVAYNLMKYTGRAGKYIFKNRLGIVSLASPTSYDSLSPEPEFIDRKLIHHTRTDDAINILLPMARVIPNKRPWPIATDDDSLWPWNPPAPQRFFSSLHELAPNKWTPLGPFWGLAGLVRIPDIGSATFLQMMAHEGDPLYAPFLNSHLLDNYLNEPTATLTYLALSAETSALLRNDLVAPVRAGLMYSPPGRPLLSKIRFDLRRLKQRLMQSG
jgi:hypothetical protein